MDCPKRRCAPSAMSRRRPASSTATATSQTVCAGAAAPARPPLGLRAAWPAPRLRRPLCLLSPLRLLRPLRLAPQQHRASRGARLVKNMRRYVANLCHPSAAITCIIGSCLQLQATARPKACTKAEAPAALHSAAVEGEERRQPDGERQEICCTSLQKAPQGSQNGHAALLHEA